MAKPEPEPEPEITKAELKRREKLAKAEAKAQRRSQKERDELQKQFEKRQEEAAKAEEKKLREDNVYAAAKEKEQAEDDWAIFSNQLGLALRVEEASGIASKNKKSTHPYVVVKHAGETFRTEVVKNSTGNPVWRQMYLFPDCEDHGRVDLEVWDKNFWGRDSPLGLVGLTVQQVLAAQTDDGYLDAWLYLNPLGSCDSPTGSLRLMATMRHHKKKRKHKGAKRPGGNLVTQQHEENRDEQQDEERLTQSEKGQQFRSRKELMDATAAVRKARDEAAAKKDMETFLNEHQRQQAEALAAKEEREKQEAEDKLAAEKKEAEKAAQVADKEEADVRLAQEQYGKERLELNAASERVQKLEESLVAVREVDGEDNEQEVQLLRDLELARQAQAAEQAEYDAAEKRLNVELMEAELAREALVQETLEVQAAQEALEREAAQAAEAAENLKAAADEAKKIVSNSKHGTGETIPDTEAATVARVEAEAGAEVEADAVEIDAANEAKMHLDERLLQAEARRKTNKQGGSNETFYSRAARRNEQIAARGTDWERRRTAQGQREWKQQRAVLAGSWRDKPGRRLTPGLYSASRLEPCTGAHKQNVAGRGARSNEYQRRRRLIEAAYPTLAEPLEPGMAAWGVRAPPPFHASPEKPRMAGKLQKWRPALLDESSIAEDACWRTRWVELRMETAAIPAFKDQAEEQNFQRAEIFQDLEAISSHLEYSEDELKLKVRSIDLKERTPAELFSDEAMSRRERRRLRPVLTYYHERGGRELGRLDLRGALLMRSWSQSQDAQRKQQCRPLMPADLKCHSDQNAAQRLRRLIGNGPRAKLLKDSVLQCVASGWEPDDPTIRSTPVGLQPHPTLASGPRSLFTVIAKDPHGGQPYVMSPNDAWEPHIRTLRGAVDGSSRLDAVLALVETDGDVVCAEATLAWGHLARPPPPNDVAKLLRTSILTTTVSASFGSLTSYGSDCDSDTKEAREYQRWIEQLRYVLWETDLQPDRPPWEGTPTPQKRPLAQTGPRSFDPPGGPQDGRVYKHKGHPAFFQPPPASLYSVRGQLRHKLEMMAQRHAPFQSGLYRQWVDEMEDATATKAAMSWRTGGKATNGGERWAPGLDDRKAVASRVVFLHTFCQANRSRMCVTPAELQFACCA